MSKVNIRSKILVVVIAVVVVLGLRYLGRTVPSNNLDRHPTILAGNAILSAKIDSFDLSIRHETITPDFKPQFQRTYFVGTLRTATPQTFLLQPDGGLDGGGLANLVVSIWPVELGPHPAKFISTRFPVYKTKMTSTNEIYFEAFSDRALEDGEYFVCLFIAKKQMGKPIRTRCDGGTLVTE